jgi:hypothetical protein
LAHALEAALARDAVPVGDTHGHKRLAVAIGVALKACGAVAIDVALRRRLFTHAGNTALRGRAIEVGHAHERSLTDVVDTNL